MERHGGTPVGLIRGTASGRSRGLIAGAFARALALTAGTAWCAPAAAVAGAVAAAPAITAASAPDVLRAVRAAGKQVVIVNVWATWCEPCRAEFPDLIRVYREFRPRGLKLVLVSADFASDLPRVRSFLAGQGVDFETYLKTGDDMAFIDGLDPKWSGALPATFVYDRVGRQTGFWEGASTFDALAARVREALGRDHGASE